MLLKDILTCIEHIQLYTSDLLFEDFANNFMITDACLYNIQIIGEAVAQLADNVKENEPKIPWGLIKGMRNRLIHEYFGTDLPIVWNVIKNELPSFKNDLLRIHQGLLAQGR